MNSTSRPPGGVTINVDLGSLYVYVIGMDNPFLCFEVPIACVLVMDSDGRADEPMLSLAAKSGLVWDEVQRQHGRQRRDTKLVLRIRRVYREINVGLSKALDCQMK